MFTLQLDLPNVSGINRRLNLHVRPIRSQYCLPACFLGGRLLLLGG